MSLPIKIRLRLSEDAAGASTSKKSCRRPQSRRTEHEKFMENPKRRSTRHKKFLSHQRKFPRPKHGEIERKKIQQDMQKSNMRNSFTADCRLNMSLAKKKPEKEREETEMWADRKKRYNVGCNKRMKKVNDRKRS